jgi:hypothetical protein
LENIIALASKDSGATPLKNSLTAPKLLSSLLMRTQNTLLPGIESNGPAVSGFVDPCAHTPPPTNMTTMATTTACLKLLELTMVSPF